MASAAVLVYGNWAVTRRNDDLHCSVELPMTAAALGASMVLEGLDGPVELNLPAGTQPGEVVVVPERGMPRLRTGGRGDLRAVC